MAVNRLWIYTRKDGSISLNKSLEVAGDVQDAELERTCREIMSDVKIWRLGVEKEYLAAQSEEEVDEAWVKLYRHMNFLGYKGEEIAGYLGELDFIRELHPKKAHSIQN